MAVYRERIQAVTVKIEATEGTDSIPTLALNAIRTVGIPRFKIQNLDDGKMDDVQFGGLGRKGRRAAKGRYVTVDLTLELRGKGTAYTAVTEYIEADALWRGAGLVPTYSAGVVSYTTLDSGMQTFSMYLYTGAKVVKCVGCIAKPKIALVAGRSGLVTFSVTGRLKEAPSEDAIVSLAINAITPPVWGEGATATTIGLLSTATAAPATLILRSLDIDFGTVEAIRSSAGATVFQGAVIVDRALTMQGVSELMDFGAFNPFAAAIAAGDALPLTTNLVTQLEGGTGNTVGIRAGIWQLEEPEVVSDGGILLYNLAGDVLAGSHSNGREIEVRYS